MEPRSTEKPESLFREIFLHTATGIAIYEPIDDGEDFVFKDINPAGARIGGLPVEAHIGRRVTDVYPGVKALGLFKVFQDVHRTGIPRRHPLSVYQDNRLQLWMENYVCRLSSGEILAVFEDATARKKLEDEKTELLKQLHRVQRMEAMATLAAGIAHDFNNILMPILGFAQMGLDRCDPESAHAPIFRRILDAGRRAKDLVGQILLLSRDEAAPPVAVDAVPILKECVKLLRAGVPKTVQLSYDPLPERAPVRASPTDLHQIIMNLTVNAYQALGRNPGSVGLRLECPCTAPEILKEAPGQADSWLHLAVRDTGPGVPEALREKIFDPYFTTKGPEHGTGLGLFIVSGIVRRLGGSIWVTDHREGGAVFHVLLPAAFQATVAAAHEKESAAIDHGTIGGRILAVDDEPDVLDVLNTYLAPHVERISLCEDPQRARDVFESHPMDFDLLLTDLNMPGMTGFELARFVKGRRPGFPVVVLTGYGAAYENLTDLSTHVDRVLYKPVSKNELLLVLKEILAERITA
ncbi:hybrid sensor histidine kinase/response regulator [Desulfosoma sp.]